MAKSSQHFYPGSARVSRAGDRVLAITNFDVPAHEPNDNVRLIQHTCRFGLPGFVHDIAKYSGRFNYPAQTTHTEVSLCAASFF